MNTFAHDGTLPALPIPTLYSLCSSLPSLAAPLLDEDELAATLSALNDFVNPGGAGEILHQALLDYRDGLGGNASWLRPLWDDMYLNWRGPLPLEMNYFFRFETERLGRDEALPRLILGLARAAGQLGAARLEPESIRTGYQSMDQAQSMLYTRVPASGTDVLLSARLSGRQTIAVLCLGQCYIVPLHDETGEMLTGERLAVELREIRLHAATLPAAPGIAAMTAARREQAAGLRTALLACRRNRLNLAAIERALFMVCLDPAHGSDDELARALLAGPADNRWFDKSLQIIATENNGLGANFEHAGCDAGIWAWLLTKVESELLEQEEAVKKDEPGESGSPALAASASRPGFKHLDWDVSEAVREELHSLRGEFAAKADGIELACGNFPAFGREGLKSLRTSPDAFLQIAFQAAQYAVFGRLRSCYEAVSMRGYAEGRTECARSSTASALAFAKGMQQGEAPGKMGELYRMAERSHLNRLVSCQRGRGIERYIYGLQYIFEQHGPELGLNEPPALFTDPGWKAIKHDALSTSGIGISCVGYFGFGPVVSDGFGIGYAPRKDESNLVVTCFKNSGLSAQHFLAAFKEAAEKMACILRRD